jgi:tyrosyl-tRNA synthetase
MLLVCLLFDFPLVFPQADVERKVKRAFCPIGVVEKNPCLNWTRHIVFGKFPTFTIQRAEQDGGNM